MITPLRADDGTVTHFLGIQAERSEDAGAEKRARDLDESLREVQHRVKNHLSMLLSLIRLEARNAKDVRASLSVLANRVEALNLLYEEFANGNRSKDGKGTVALGAYVSRVCSALNMLDGPREVRMNLQTDRVRANIDAASQIGLLVSELLTNSLQHAFDGEAQGLVEVRLWNSEDDGTVCLQVADNGSGIPDDCNRPQEGNLGARIVRDLVARVNGDLSVESDSAGTNITIAIPAAALEPA